MAPVVVHLNGGCCSPSTFEKLAQTDYDQEIEQINVTYGRRQWCTSKLGPVIALITCTGFVLIFCGILATFGSIGDFAEEIGEPCRRRLQTGSCCIATAGGDQFLCQSSTEFFCTGAGSRCTWTCAAPPPPPGGTSDTSGCDEEDVKPPLLNVFIRLGFVIFLAGAPAGGWRRRPCTAPQAPLYPTAPYRHRLLDPLRRPTLHGAPRGRKRCDAASY